MANSSKPIAISVAAFVVLAASAMVAQNSAENTSPKSSSTRMHQAAPNTVQKKSSLPAVTRVSTAEAAKKAATEATSTKAKPEETRKASEASEAPDVMEFRPASRDEEHAQAPTASAKSSRKAVHGEAYGALDPKHPGTHRAGGAAGATSKSGKTSVYVETDQSKSTSPTPH
ncbi:MAG: hypothetical protein ABSB82_22885 [Terriglobia bacterium]